MLGRACGKGSTQICNPASACGLPAVFRDQLRIQKADELLLVTTRAACWVSGQARSREAYLAFSRRRRALPSWAETEERGALRDPLCFF